MRLAVSAALCLAAGCAGPGVIKAYSGAERGDSDLATVVTTWRDSEYSSTDNVINLVDDVLEGYRDPGPDPSAPSGWRYRSAVRLRRGDTLTLAAVSGARVNVADVLP